jgi:lipopolysaccharide assembly outer membrane protein LptD (OstA)
VNVPKFDDIDSTNKPEGSARSRSMSYGITQRLIAKQVQEEAWKKFQDEEGDEMLIIEDLDTENKEWAVWSITQSYNFEAERRHFSDITTKFTLKPIKNYTLSVTGRFDVYIKSFVDTNAEFKVDNLLNVLDASIRWRRHADVQTGTDDITAINRSLNLTTNLRLSDRIRLSYQGYFDVDTGKRNRDNIAFTYDAQCWNISATYWQHLLEDTDDHGFRILLELRHLGKLLDVKG